MTPRQADATTRTAPDLFRERLDNMLNQRHALYRLADLRIRGQVAQCTREGAATLTILKCLCIVRPDPVHLLSKINPNFTKMASCVCQLVGLSLSDMISNQQRQRDDVDDNL